MMKYSINDSSLVSIADAVRNKIGKTDKMTLEQIVSSIENISTSEKIYETDFVPAVDVIGEETDTYIPIEHNLGVVPKTIIIARKQFSGTVKYENFYSIVTSCCLSNSLLAAQAYYGGTKTQDGEDDIDVDTQVDFTIGSFNNSEKTSVINVTETSLNIVGQLGSSKARLKAGKEYHLVIIA